MIRELAAGVVLLLLQCITGTDPVFAAAMSLAVAAGLASIRVAGGWTSLAGLLNAVLLGRFLVLGLAMKLMVLDRTDRPLEAPLETALVCMMGFLGVLAGSALFARIPSRKPLMPEITDPRDYVSLYLLVIAFGFGAWMYTYVGRQEIFGFDSDAPVEEAVGGLYGVFGFFGTIKYFAISCAIYHVHLSGSQRLFTHPLVLGTLLVSLMVGTYSTSKREMMEPLIFLTVPVLQLRGPRYRPFWVMVVGSVLVFGLIVYPYSQYVRFAGGGRVGSTMERIERMADTLERLVSDPNFRADAHETVIERHDPYLPFGQRMLFRFALFIEADRLINASRQQTGWDTITWGFEMVPPRFLYPAKPRLAANNFLGHLTGDVNERDLYTQISYGFMANFFNAFGLIGVGLGSLVLVAGLYAWILLFFGRPGTSSIWVALVFGHYQHPLTEQSVSGLIADIWWPVIVLIIYRSATLLRPWLDRRRAK